MKSEEGKERIFCTGTDIVNGTSSTATINSYTTKDRETEPNVSNTGSEETKKEIFLKF